LTYTGMSTGPAVKGWPFLLSSRRARLMRNFLMGAWGFVFLLIRDLDLLAYIQAAGSLRRGGSGTIERILEVEVTKKCLNVGVSSSAV
jgi:hypothetical protein